MSTWAIRATSPPPGWRVRRVIDLVHLVNGYPFPSEAFGPDGTVPLVRVRDLLSSDFETFLSVPVPRGAAVRDGDVVIGMDGDFNLVQWKRGPAALNQRLCLLRPRGDVDIRFIAYALPHVLSIINSLTFATTVKHLSSLDVLGERLLLPPLPEQQRIADFLDVETARIEAVLSIIDRKIELLDERAVALASQLCLRGTRTGIDTRDSCIDPVGMIPAHWRVVRNKTLFREVVDLSRVGEETLLTVSHITGVSPRKDKNVYMFMADSMVGYKKCQPGDLVINTLWAWMGALGISPHSGIVSPAYGVYRLTKLDALPRYLDLLYRTPEYVSEMTRYSKGVWTSRLRLYPESFLGLRTPLPPIAEQEAIVSAVEGELEPANRLKAMLRTTRALLNERRQALITAAVTGQFDVTTGRSVDLS